MSDHVIHKSHSLSLLSSAPDNAQANDGVLEKQTYGGFHFLHLEMEPGHNPYFFIDFLLLFGDQ
jgi:hypothetical protein